MGHSFLRVRFVLRSSCFALYCIVLYCIVFFLLPLYAVVLYARLNVSHSNRTGQRGTLFQTEKWQLVVSPRVSYFCSSLLFSSLSPVSLYPKDSDFALDRSNRCRLCIVCRKYSIGTFEALRYAQLIMSRARTSNTLVIVVDVVPLCVFVCMSFLCMFICLFAAWRPPHAEGEQEKALVCRKGTKTFRGSAFVSIYDRQIDSTTPSRVVSSGEVT